MKILISGKEYDMEAALTRPSLLTLMELQAKAGIGMKTLMETSREFQGKSPLDIIEDEQTLKVFAGIIWLARRNAGEKITFEEAASVPLDEYEWVHEEAAAGDAEVAAERPTQARTASGRAKAKPTARTTAGGARRPKAASTT